MLINYELQSKGNENFFCIFSGKRAFYLPEPSHSNKMETLDIASSQSRFDLDPSEPICPDPTLFERHHRHLHHH